MNDNYLSKKSLILAFILLIEISNSSNISNEDETTKIESSKKQITVHAFLHSHLDVGWLKTVDEYYEIKVKQIFENLYNFLIEENQAKFVICEIEFFKRWYDLKTKNIKENIVSFVNNGRLEFVLGGWVQHDEATTYFFNIITQMKLGLTFLNEEFKYQPRVGWMIDQFGHSSVSSYLLKEFGLKEIILVRINNVEKEYRKNYKKLEFYWDVESYFKEFSGFKNITEFDFEKSIKNSIFTHIAISHYNLFIDESLLKEVNYNFEDHGDSLLEDFEINIKKHLTSFYHTNLILFLGDDFTFYDKYALNNIKTFINLVNKKSNLAEIKYSTPSDYFSDVRKATIDFKFPIEKNIDFFPYSDNGNDYWSGFYTTRPNLKLKIVETSSIYDLSSKFLIESILHKNDCNIIDSINKLFYLKRAISVCQHHDASTGTCRELVAQDYENSLDYSNIFGQEIIKSSLKNIYFLNKCSLESKEKFKFNLSLYNQTNFTFSNQNNFQMGEKLSTGNTFSLLNENIKFCYQSFSNDRCHKINLKENDDYFTIDFIKNNNEEYIQSLYLNNSNFNVYTHDFKLVPSDIFEEKYSLVLKVYPDYFYEKDYPFKLYFKVKFNGRNIVRYIFKREKRDLLIFDSKNGKNINFPLTDFKVNSLRNISISSTLYLSHLKNKDLNDTITEDGAYIFSYDYLTEDSSEIYFKLNTENSNIFDYFYSFLLNKQIIHVKKFKNKEFLEVVSSINPKESIYKQANKFNIFLNFKSNINNTVKLNSTTNSTVFWTDTNGFGMRRRIKNIYNFPFLITKSNVAQNIYPSTFCVSIRNSKNKFFTNLNPYSDLSSNDSTFTVYIDRPHGVTSINNSEINILIDRSSGDDSRGISQNYFEFSSGLRPYTMYNYVSFDLNLDKEIYNLIHSKPILIFDSNIKTSKIERKFILDSIFESNCLVKYDIISDKIFHIMFINRNDPYFSELDNNNLESKRVNSKCYFKFKESNKYFYELNMSENFKKKSDTYEIGKIYYLSFLQIKLFQIDF